MPAAFRRCVRAGGRVRTLSFPSKSKYLHVCWDARGRSHAGEVRAKQTRSKRNPRVRARALNGKPGFK